MSQTARQILESCRTWAVVGLSANPDRASYRVARFLRGQGYRVVPVHPRLQIWEGLPAYPNVEAIPGPVDVVDLFRRSEEVPPHVDEAIRCGARVVWMQLGIRHAEAAERARQAGLTVVEDRCPVIESRRIWPAGDGPRFAEGGEATDQKR